VAFVRFLTQAQALEVRLGRAPWTRRRLDRLGVGRLASALTPVTEAEPGSVLTRLPYTLEEALPAMAGRPSSRQRPGHLAHALDESGDMHSLLSHTRMEIQASS
jgi:hypothetical protein